MKNFHKISIFIGILGVMFYRLIIRPFFPSSCIFTPTCSEYTLQAIKKYGLFRGIILGFRRFLRCHGGNIGGYDSLI